MLSSVLALRHQGGHQAFKGASSIRKPPKKRSNEVSDGASKLPKDLASLVSHYAERNRVKNIHMIGGSQRRSMKYQIDPTAMRMETGKEAPCRRFYKEENNMYSLHSFEGMKDVMTWVAKTEEKHMYLGEKKMQSEFDPEKQSEVDDPLDIYAKQSWWHRPEWYRTGLSYLSQDKAGELTQFFKDIVTGTGRKNAANNPIRAALKRQWRVLVDGTYSTSSDRLSEVTEQLEEIAERPSLQGPGGFPPMLEMIRGQERRLRMAFRSDYRDFWRSYKPLKSWQSPAGLAEPDPAVNVVQHKFWAKDVLFGNSAVEDDLEAFEDVARKSWNPLKKVALYTVMQPDMQSDRYAAVASTIADRERERRTSTYDAMLPRPSADIFYDHVPGWNHATHTWEYGRRLPMLRSIAEDAELQARYPEPMGKTDRRESMPRGMQTLYQFRAFPDPVFSLYSDINDVEIGKMVTSIQLTGDIEEARQFVPEEIRPPPRGVPHEQTRHWLYVSDPETAHYLKRNERPGLEEDKAWVQQLEDSLETPETAHANYEGSLEHMKNREAGIPTTWTEQAEAFQMRIDDATSFQTSQIYNPILASGHRLYTFLRHGSPKGAPTTALQRMLGFAKVYWQAPSETKLTPSRLLSEYWAAYRLHLHARKRSMKEGLGINDEKLLYMHEYLSEKELAKERARQGLHPDSLPSEPTQQPPSNAFTQFNHSQPQKTPTPEEIELLSRLQNGTLARGPPPAPLPGTAAYKAKTPSSVSQQHLDILKAPANQTASFYDPEPSPSSSSSSSSSTQRAASTTTANSSRKKQARSYSTSTASSATPRAHTRLAQPWVIARQFHSSRAANNQMRDQETDPVREDFLGLFQRRGHVERGSIVADVSPRRSGSQSTSSSDVERDATHTQLAKMMELAQAATSENDLYALPTKKFGASGARRPPVTNRETYLASQRRNGNSSSSAPFPAAEVSMNDLSLRHILPSSLRNPNGFSDAVWGISKAFGRVVSNLVRTAMEKSNRKLRMPSTLEEDMSKIVEWQTSRTRVAVWEKYRAQFLTFGRTLRLRLPELADSFELLYQTVHPTHAISGTTHIATVALAKEDAQNRDFVLEYVRASLIPRVTMPLPGPNYPERLQDYYRSMKSDTPESMKTEEVMGLIDANAGDRNWEEAFRRTSALYGTTSNTEAAKQRLFADISQDLSNKKLEQDNALSHARKPLEGVADFVVRDKQTGVATSFDADAIWTDPKVRFHSPEAWKLLTSEFRQIDTEITENCLQEIARRSLELSDFESMLFYLQPFIDRMLAHPQDIKARIFYIMKLNSYATSDQLQKPEWKPSDPKEASWMAKFNDMEEDKLGTDPISLITERRRPIIDRPTSSLTEILFQLGVTPSQLPRTGDGLLTDNYQSHIDYPFLYVKDDGSFIDLNPEGEMDPLMKNARSLASPSDYVHQQHARSPYSSLKHLLNDDPMFLTKAWVRTLAHLRYQDQLRESWKPMAEDEDLPRLIADLEKRLSVAKSLQSSHDESDMHTQKEYETMRDLIADLASDLKLHPSTSSDSSSASASVDETSTFKTIPTLEQSGMTQSEYFTFGSMVASLSSDANCRTFVPPPMQEAYIDAASTPRTDADFAALIERMQKHRDELELKVESFVATTRPKREYSSYNPHLYMPYTPIPRSRSLATHWKGTEPLILHAPLMPLHIAVGLMQYMTSLKRNLASDDYRTRLQAWLAVRPELLPYVAKLTEYNEKFVKAVVNGEPLPYGEDLEKTFFHWTISDHVQHFTAGYIEDMRVDRLMALSDLHVLLFGNDSEKQLLRQQRRDLQRKALVELEQKIAGTPVADALSTCPTVVANAQGGEERLEYTLSERIKNTFQLIGKEMEGDTLMVPLEVPLTEMQRHAQDFYDDDAGTKGALEREYEHLSHEEAAIERYKDKHGINPPKPVRPTHIHSSVVLPSEQENIDILKARFMKHSPNVVTKLPSVRSSSVGASPHSAQAPIPKDMLPLAGLNPNDWKHRVTAEEMTLQRLHLLRFDPSNPATHGNYPYDWAENAGSSDFAAFGLTPRPNMTMASILTEKPRFSLLDLLGTPLSANDDFLSEQDEGVKLARTVGDPDLIREAKFLFSVKDADQSDHADERTIRLCEFVMLKQNEDQIQNQQLHHLRMPNYLPRRVKVSPALKRASDSIKMQNEADSQAWIRRRYNSWLGQDPLSRTFDIATALNANNVSKRQFSASGKAQLSSTQMQHVPDPSTVWGPTQKSFYDLERELRFQLATAIPEDVETILQEEKEKFISELEARLIAYRTMERVSHSRKKSDRLGEVEKRLRVLEIERQQRKGDLSGGSTAEMVELSLDSEGKALEESVLLDDTLLESIVKEREALLRERENLKLDVVALELGKQTSEDETWNRLQQALEALKGLPSEAGSVKRAKAEGDAVQADADVHALTVVPEKLWKSEEEEELERRLEERKKLRLEEEEFEATGKRKPETIDVNELLSPRQQLAQELVDVVPHVDRPKNEAVRQKKMERILATKRAGTRRRGSRTGGRIWRALFPGGKGKYLDVRDDPVPDEADLIWRNSYGDLSRENWETMIANNVQYMNAKILDGTPQCVRLVCHSEAIEQIEKFYEGDFAKVHVQGIAPPICIEQRWEPRSSDDAYIATSIWSTGVFYSTMFQPPMHQPNVAYRTDITSLEPFHTTIVGNIYTIMESTPERGFYVTDWAFDLATPDLPEPVSPIQEYVSGKEIEEVRRADEEPVRPAMLPFGPPPRQERYRKDTPGSKPL